MPNNLFVSFMRTFVPLVAALVLGTAARWGWDLDDAAVTSYVTVGLAAAYYFVFRVLEVVAQRKAWRPLQTTVGILLGWAKPPEYVTPGTAPLRQTSRPPNGQ